MKIGADSIGILRKCRFGNLRFSFLLVIRGSLDTAAILLGGCIFMENKMFWNTVLKKWNNRLIIYAIVPKWAYCEPY